MTHSNNIILAFGLERSGTTWLGKILDSHPDTVYRHEPDSEYRIDDIPLFVDKTLTNKYATYINEYIDNIIDIRSTSVCAKLPIFKKSYYNITKYYIIKSSAFLSKITKHYLSRDIPIISSADHSALLKQSLIWKSIESFSRLGLISNSITNSKTIYIIRHPCGFISSLLKGRKDGFMPYNDKSEVDVDFWTRRLTCDVAKENNLDLQTIQSISRIEELAWRWLVDNEQVLRDIENSSKTLVVIYDELCENPLYVTKKIFNFCGLSWNNQTEKFINASTTTNDQKYFSVYKDPKIAANKWRQQLKDEDIHTVKRIVKNSECGKLFLDKF